MNIVLILLRRHKMDKIENEAELDPFSVNAKSSVEISNTTRGITWKIKVVTGEEKLIMILMEEAIKVHKELESKLKEVK